MLLRCVNAFGNFKPGETVEVPDGAGFDHAYFEELEQPEADFAVLAKELYQEVSE